MYVSKLATICSFRVVTTATAARLGRKWSVSIILQADSRSAPSGVCAVLGCCPLTAQAGFSEQDLSISGERSVR